MTSAPPLILRKWNKYPNESNTLKPVKLSDQMDLIIPSKQNLCSKPALSQRKHRLKFKASSCWVRTEISLLGIFRKNNAW